MKRLFTCMNVKENDMDFYKNIVEELKSCKWVKVGDSDKFLCESVPFLTFYKMTAIDYRYFEEKNISFRYEIIYSKTTDNQFSWEVNFYENEERQYSDYLLVENDDLELFSRLEGQKEQSDWRDVLSYTLNQILQSESVEDVVDYIDNNFSSISDKIRENCVESLSKDDLDSDLVEEVGKSWVEKNTSDAWDLIEENAYTSDLKDIVIRVIENNM